MQDPKREPKVPKRGLGTEFRAKAIVIAFLPRSEGNQMELTTQSGQLSKLSRLSVLGRGELRSNFIFKKYFLGLEL